MGALAMGQGAFLCPRTGLWTCTQSMRNKKEMGTAVFLCLGPVRSGRSRNVDRLWWIRTLPVLEIL